MRGHAGGLDLEPREPIVLRDDLQPGGFADDRGVRFPFPRAAVQVTVSRRDKHMVFHELFSARIVDFCFERYRPLVPLHRWFMKWAA